MLYPERTIAEDNNNKDSSPKISTPPIKLVNNINNYSPNYTKSHNKLQSQSVDVTETLQLISDLEINQNKNNSNSDYMKEKEMKKKRMLKLNPLKKSRNKRNRKNNKDSISRSLSETGSHSPTSTKMNTHQLPTLDTSKLSRSNSLSQSTSNNSFSPINNINNTSYRNNLISAISSIASSSDYITPKSNVSTRSSSVSSMSSMEWDTKNMKTWNKEKTKKVLFRCTRHGRYKDIKNMLEKGINPNTMDEYGNTILLVAAQNGSKKLVKTALRYNANINHQNYRGNTAMHYAFAYGYKLLGEYILSKGGDDRVKNEFGLTCYEGIKVNSSLNKKIKKSKTNKTAKEILKDPEPKKAL